MAILDVQNLEKHFGSTRVLNDISFSLEKGNALAIIGAFLLMTPNMMFNLVGIGIAAAVIVIQKAAGGRVNAAAA